MSSLIVKDTRGYVGAYSLPVTQVSWSIISFASVVCGSRLLWSKESSLSLFRHVVESTSSKPDTLDSQLDKLGRLPLYHPSLVKWENNSNSS